MASSHLARLVAARSRPAAQVPRRGALRDAWLGAGAMLARVVAAVAMLLPLPVLAALVSVGPDAGFVPRSLTALSSVPVPLGSLGDGSWGFNGGLVYDGGSSRLFGIANDSQGNSQLYSFTATGGGLTAVGSGLGQGFYGGLARDPLSGSFYGVADDMFGAATLYAISSAGVATSLGSIGNGYYGGLAWAKGQLYAVAGDAFGVQRSVYAIDVAAVTATLAFSLGDGASSFNGGLAYDNVADRFYTIGNDAFGDSALYSFTAGGAGLDLAALGGPFGQGFVNAGLAIVPDDQVPVSLPEAPTLALAVLALGLVAFSRAGRRANAI